MLANAIDEPSVLSRSVEACSSFSKTNQERREDEERGKREGKHQWTVMESREEGKDASAADTLRLLSVVWEH